MRIDPAAHPIPGPAPAGGEVAITVDGRPLTARAGEPIAMALLAHGIDRCRTTPKEGAPRGLFCGVGRCPDCAMIVDGALNVPTCITPVRAGMAIETQHGLGRWQARNAERGTTNKDEETDTESARNPRDSAFRAPRSALVVVGGGPAGLAAALGAARAGVRATLIDEWPEPGGQLRHRLAPVGGGHDGPRGVELASIADLDEEQVSSWMKQAATMPFFGGKKR